MEVPRPAGRITRLWAAVVVALYPPGFRSAVGRDLSRLLLDGARDARRIGRGALGRFLLANTALGVRDAALEWGAVIAEGWTNGRREAVATSWLYSLRLAARGLLRHPGYSVPVLITLALGIGANTATFTVLNSVVLRPLPYPRAEALVRVHPTDVDSDRRLAAFSLPDVRDWEERSTTLGALGAYTMLNSDLVYTGADDALEVETAYVTAGFYSVMEVRPLLGRLPTAEEEMGDNRVVVVSHAFWQQHLGSDSALVGMTLPLSGEAYRIAGVMPPSFDFPSPRVGIWAFLTVIPASSTPYHLRQVRLLDAVGRLAEGASLEQAREDLTSVAVGLASELPESNQRLRAATVVRLQERVVGDVARALAILMSAALLILVITCANLANLALAREARRAPELAVRAALGASRGRRAGLVLGESVILSACGGALGLALAAWGTRALVATSAGALPRAHEIAPDWRVAIFTLVASLVTGASFALLASVAASRADVSGRLHASGRGAAAGGMRGALVVSQISLSVILLVGSLLLVESLRALARVDPGFDAEGLIVAEMTFSSNRFPERSDYLARFDATLEALGAVPGVGSVSTIRRFPFRGTGEGARWTPPGAAEGDEGVPVNLLQVSGRLFETMGIAMLEGTDFAQGGDEDRPVAIVGRSVARTAFGGGPTVGRTLMVAGYELEIVGVVEDIRQSDLRGDPPGVLYLPNRLSPRRAAAFVVRPRPDVAVSLAEVRAAVRAADARQPITELALASDIVAEQLMQPRFYTLLLAVFAGLALALCSVGVYGVVAFGVSRRTREVGIRIALGAEPARVRSLVVRQGMRPVLAGIAVGLALTLTASRSLDTLLFAVPRFDAGVYLASAALLGVIGLAACWLPARRAAAGRAAEALASE